MLKPVNKEKNPGLAKLPEKVRNKMGYAKKGKMLKARYGTMAKGDVKEGLKKSEAFDKKLADFRKETFKKLRKARVGVAEEASYDKLFPLKTDKASTIESKMKTIKLKLSKLKVGGVIKANVGMAAKKVREKDMMKASMGMEAKSTRGYGAARTSGMGLQDEQLVPGKSMDYYKDLM